MTGRVIANYHRDTEGTEKKLKNGELRDKLREEWKPLWHRITDDGESKMKITYEKNINAYTKLKGTS